MRVMGTKPEGRTVAQMVLFLGITILLVSTYATLNSQDSHHQQQPIVAAQNEHLKKFADGANIPVHENQNVENNLNLKVEDNFKKKKENEIRQEPPNPFPPDAKVNEKIV